MTLATLSVNLAFVILSIALLWKGAGWLVNSASRIAHRFNISDLVIGLTVVAIGTSAPEFAVTVSAALANKANISVGNVVGSNIFNLGFILGGAALIRAISTSSKLVWRDGIFLITVTVVLYFFLNDLTLSKFEGLTLMSTLILYILFLFWKGEKPEEEIPGGKANWLDFVLLIVGISSVVGGGHLLVDSASDVARYFGISEWVIGVTIVAAGTSAPELATTLTAAFNEKHGIAIGNLIGSDLFNLLGVLGLAALIRPLTVDAAAHGSIALLIAMVCLVVFFMRTGWGISRLEGGILVGLNLLRWVFDFT